MYAIHKTLPIRDFKRPASGLTYAEVCSVSGAKPSPACARRFSEIFITGTQPQEECSMCAARYTLSVAGEHKVESEVNQIGSESVWASVEEENNEFLQSMLDQYFSEEEIVSMYQSDILSEKAFESTGKQRSFGEEKNSFGEKEETGAQPAEQEELDLLTEENPLLGI